jgi:epoxyqueuosine reductase
LERDAAMRRFLEAEAAACGFDAIGIADAEGSRLAGRHLAEFVADGRHGSMAWMEQTLERRMSPRAMWPDARSAIVLGMNYGPADDPLQSLAKPARATISVYARNRDYHDIIKGRLKTMASRFAARFDVEVKVFVDTAPLMEKPLAALAGLGWQGKHTNLVSRAHGSWLFLGVILTAAVIAPDEPEIDHCGTCRACLDVCPTAAFPAPYQLDARRCISYLTIEHRGPIPHEFRAAIGNRIYGCDDCLAVCPWNKFASEASVAALQAREELESPPLAALLALDDQSFRTLFAGSPVKRIGRDRFLRNVLVAAGNSADAALLAPVAALLGDPSALVRGTAAWAAARLAGSHPGAAALNGTLTIMAQARATETDAMVLAEWHAIDEPGGAETDGTA